MRWLVLLLPLLFMVACASISEDQCRAGNWNAIGFNDGKAGRSPDYLANHIEACAEAGITPDRAEWQAGRAQGLQLYCTPDHAYDLGRSGKPVANVCPVAMTRMLVRANDWGQDYYEIGQEIDDLRDERDELRQLLAAMTGDLTDEQKALRRSYRQRLARVEDKLFDLQGDQRRHDSLPQSLMANL